MPLDLPASGASAKKIADIPAELTMLKFSRSKIKTLTADYPDQTLGGLRKFEEMYITDGIKRRYVYSIEFVKIIRKRQPRKGARASSKDKGRERNVGKDIKTVAKPRQRRASLEASGSPGTPVKRRAPRCARVKAEPPVADTAARKKPVEVQSESPTKAQNELQDGTPKKQARERAGRKQAASKCKPRLTEQAQDAPHIEVLAAPESGPKDKETENMTQL